MEIENQENPIENRPLDELDSRPFAETLQKIAKIKSECSKTIVGHHEIIDIMIACILCEGHILLEGVPGIAKTLTAKSLAKTLDAKFSRIQFTPDLMPTDILGTSIYNTKESVFIFQQGPIFSNIVLIDEINRAPAKTQSALFEVMEEQQVSFDGKSYSMEFPFLVIATQNPIEQEGTYRLPEAQLDRFLIKLILSYPSKDEEIEILNKYIHTATTSALGQIHPVIQAKDIRSIQNDLKSVHVEPQIVDYIAQVINETRNHVNLYLGASPRASLATLRLAKVIAMMAERSFVIPDDVQFVAPYVLNHRILLTPEAEMRNITTFDVINDILKNVEVPR